MIGMLIVVISFFVGILRLFNQVTLESIMDTASAAYLSASTIEVVLHAYAEIVPLYGLGILKLGIGFAIVTIVVNLRTTGENARASLTKINLQPPEMKPPLFARIFAKILVLGILIETIAVFITMGWMAAEAAIIDPSLAHIFEIFAEPIEGLGVSLLIVVLHLGLLQ